MDGIIIINKEKEWTSNDVVQKVKHLTHEKVGHTGTLDPMATGVLPLLIGKGTNLSKYMINHDKEYIATIKLEKKTSTGDSEGEIIEEKKVDGNLIEKSNVEKVLKSFIGKNLQIPPMYSAIKVNGKKLYEYARKGQEIKIEPREIFIYDIKLLDIDLENKEIKYMVNCSKGTYIRTLCEDIASKFGTVGYMKNLCRTKVGEFEIEKSFTISQIENEENLEEKIITIEKFFLNKKEIILNDWNLKLFLNGVKLDYQNEEGICRVYNSQKKFIGIGVVENGKLKRDIIL